MRLLTAFGGLLIMVLCAPTVPGEEATGSGAEKVELWQDAAPQAGGEEPGDRPHLLLYRVQSDRPTPAVVILPGGGYRNLAMGHEGHEIAEFFNRLGITAAVCVYRHRGAGNRGEGYGHPVPMLDARRAIRTVRASADKWNVDPERVGIIGFSAGGHLASTVSTKFDAGDADADDPIERVSSRPDFSILAYPVISFGQPHTHQGSQRNLLGENPDPELVRSLSGETAVTQETPPTFLFHTAEDTGVPPQNSLEYYAALLRAGVPAELHVFESGRHGIGLAAGQPGTEAWPRLCAAWLKKHGFAP